MSDAARLRALTERFAGLRVGVLGDLILDRYVWGSVERISPEAPVPVVRVDHESVMLGGAGNVARNLASLGARVWLAAVTGDDDPAREITRLCARWKIDAGGVIADASRPTTLKTRVIARAQQVVRYDRETERPIAAAVVDDLLEGLRAQAGQLDGVIVEDYGKGLLTLDVLREAMAIFGEHEVAVFVDPKEGEWEIYRGAELVKPNLREAEQILRLRVQGEADLERLGQKLLERTGVRNVAITRGEGGISIFSRSEGVHHVPTVPRPVADVAGAGDTAIATLTLARLAGASWREAAELANAAAGFVVAIPGTATLTPEDLLRSFGASA